MNIKLSRRYIFVVSGLGIAEIAAGTSILCLTLASAETLANPSAYSQELYTYASFVVSSLTIVTGIIAIGSVKRATMCYMLLSMIISTVNALGTVALAGLQAFVITFWNRNTDHPITNYTLAALIIGTLASSASFLMGVTTICITCTEVGAYGITKTKVQPLETVSEKPKTKTTATKSKAKETKENSATDAVKREDPKPPTPLPLHAERPKTSKNAVDQWPWDETPLSTTKQSQPIYAEDT